MSRDDDSGRGRPTRWRSVVSAAMLTALLTACASAGDDSHGPLSDQPSRMPQTAVAPGEPEPDLPAKAAPASVAPAKVTPAKVASAHVAPAETTPAWLDIPAIGVSTALDSLGLNADRTVEVPDRPQRAGWFDLGTVPGSSGSSVILGHVDSVDGPAVFYRLDQLRAGDLIDVSLSDATVATFRVVRVATYPNAAFPARQVYAGSPRGRTLNLVTCGGEYDSEAGGYQSNVVVYSTLVT